MNPQSSQQKTNTNGVYLTLPVEIRNNMQIVDNAQSLGNFLRKLDKELNETTECHVLLGWDSEWRPTFIKGQLAKTAVLQFALLDAVFLLDIPALRAKMGSAVASERVFSILNNARLRKLVVGGVNNDLDPLQRAFCVTNEINIVNVVCLSQLHAALVHAEQNGKIIQKVNCGLATLCRYYLGKLLQKPRHITMTNWELRPLTERQKDYAAMDAYAPILIYKVMQKRAVELRINVDSIAQGLATDTQERLKTRKPKTAGSQPDGNMLHKKPRKAQTLIHHQTPSALSA